MSVFIVVGRCLLGIGIGRCRLLIVATDDISGRDRQAKHPNMHPHNSSSNKESGPRVNSIDLGDAREVYPARYSL
jgi:hypothetical protein